MRSSRKALADYRQDLLPIKVHVTPWSIKIGHVTHPFTSLSQMGRWLDSNPVHPDTIVTLTRNDRPVYTGPWGEGLCESQPCSTMVLEPGQHRPPHS